MGRQMQTVIPRRSPEGGGDPPGTLIPGEIWVDVTPGNVRIFVGDGTGSPVQAGHDDGGGTPVYVTADLTQPSAIENIPGTYAIGTTEGTVDASWGVGDIDVQPGDMLLGDGTAWHLIEGNVDLSGYATTEDLSGYATTEDLSGLVIDAGEY